MRHSGESMPAGQSPLEFHWETLVHFHDQLTARANQVMVVAVVPLRYKFKPRNPVAKIKSTDQDHVFERVEIPIDGRQIASLLSQRRMDFPVAHRVLMPPEDLENCLAGPGDLAGMLSQFRGQFSEGLLDQAVRVSVLAAGITHAGLDWGRARRNRLTESDARNKATLVSTMVGPQGESNW